MALPRFTLPFADVGGGIAPASGAKLFFYATGTNILKDTFADSGATTPNANPVIADARGVFPDIFLSGTYKVVLKDKNDVQKWSADPVLEPGADLQAIARSLNVADSAVIYSTDTVTVLDNVLYIYDASTQTTWGKPAGVGAGETITDVTGSALTTTGGSYTLFGAIGAYVYSNLDKLKNDTSLKIGQVVETAGYTTAGDGGGNKYKIVASGTGTDDGGSYIDLTASGLQAKGLFDSGVNVAQFGAVGDGSARDTGGPSTGTDDASRIRNAISGSLSDVFVPKTDNGDGYIIDSSIEIDAGQNFKMSPATYLMPPNNVTAFKINRDDSRLGQRVIENLRVWAGRDSTVAESSNIVGIQDFGSLNTEQYNSYASGCLYGMRQQRTMEYNGVGGLFQYNYIGQILESDATDGGANANTYTGKRYQGNQLGLMIKKNAAFPLHNNTWSGTLFQENLHCALCVVDNVGESGLKNILFQGGHVEANASGGGAGNKTFNGVSIPNVPVYLKNAQSVTMRNYEISENVDKCVYIDNSILHADSVGGFGASANWFYWTVNGGKVFESGDCQLIGKRKGLASYGKPRSFARSFTEGIANQKNNRAILNSYSGLDAMEPDVTTHNIVSNTLVTDSQTGLRAREWVFDTVAGSTSVNRVVPTTLPSVGDGNLEFVSFMIRADAPTTMKIAWLNTGHYETEIELDTTFRRIVISNNATGASNPNLYLYPAGTDGPTVYFTAIYCTSSERFSQQHYETGEMSPKDGSF